MPNFSQSLQKWDQLIRDGSPNEVRSDLKKIVLKNIERSARIEIAKICRRVHLYQMATQILFPVVRGNDDLEANADSREVAEYAASLICLGSIHEARTLLSNAQPSECPEIFLYQAFADIMSWNFSSAVEFLNQYLQSAQINEYQRRVAEVNMASSLVGCQRFQEARTLMLKVVEEAKALNQTLIYTTTLSHLADLYLETEELDAARETINLARTEIPESDFPHHLLLDKIRAKLGAITGAERVTPALFDQIKDRAMQLGVYEIARDCDFSRAKWFDDDQARLAAYIGTVFPSFRQKFNSIAFTPPADAFVSRIDLARTDVTLKQPEFFLDLENPVDLTKGETTHRTLGALNQDFYRPLMMGEFFEYLFPKTFYDPFTSPDRIHQVIRRTRAWLKKHEMPLSMIVNERGLILKNTSDFYIRVPSDRSSVLKSNFEQILSKAFEYYGESPFQVNDLCAKNIGTERQIRRCITHAVATGELVKIGKGIYTSYHFARKPAA